MAGSRRSEGKRHRHRRKFTEGLLDKELILNALHIEAGQTILDAGCGNGYMSKVFSDEVGHSGKVYALDPDQYMINALAKETRGTNIEAIAGDITKETPIKEFSVDLVYLSTVIHGFSKNQMAGFLQEVKRILKADASLAIVEIDKIETPFGPPLEIRFSPDEIKAIIPMVPVNTLQVGEHFYMQVFTNKEKQVT